MSEVSASTKVPTDSNSEKPATTVSGNVETEHADSEENKLDNNAVQRAIEGLAEIPDDKLDEFFNDKDFIDELAVVDTWEGGTEKSPDSSRGEERNKDRERTKSSRERPRRERRSSHNRDRERDRDRAKREERRREDLRRDPSKSSKDIERDKMRTKKDTARKILAEKEKAIKNLLESDNVVPPGTEVEAIQDISDKHISERTTTRSNRKSRDRRRSPDRRMNTPPRRRSNDRTRLSPNRRMDDERRPLRVTPERRKSWERRASRDRSIERHRRREERERQAARRSRSRDRHRSRSMDRYRKRWSRSPNGRRSSSRRRSNSRRRSRSKSSDRRVTRKRSPFINEIARQFGAEGLMQTEQTAGFLPGIPPLLNPTFPQDQIAPVPPPSSMQQFMHHPGPPGPSGMHMQQGGNQQFVNFDPRAPMNFEPGRGPLLHTPQPDYSSAPIMYNQGNPQRAMQPQQGLIGPPMLSMPMTSPQPVPAPVEPTPMSYNQNRGPSHIPSETLQLHMEMASRHGRSPKSSYPNLNLNSSAYNGLEAHHSERLKTPEPPVISKPFEKTSLSSLLEASVSAKGFKPEILQQCEVALRELPAEDRRFKMKGRFFFDPSKDDAEPIVQDSGSNSILLRGGRGKLLWETSDKMQNSTDTTRPFVETHQKICQTDETLTESKAVQVEIKPKTADFSQQIFPGELQQVTKEEKRPIMDRLDWNVRENYDYPNKLRDTDDLRWTLNNWNRGLSPPDVLVEDRRINSPPSGQMDRDDRRGGMNVPPSTRPRDNYPFDRSSSREHYSRDQFSPPYRRSIERQEDFHDVRSDHSRGESPMVLEEPPDEVEILDEDHYSRGSDWRSSRGNTSFAPRQSALQKIQNLRGKASGRTFRGRGGFRGKF
ncbi:uncharacterized protein [Venturia canescens]|uniref:uncharacterized protein isoform X2 n=1 Tax=Venturia canescens TaxID=32260 RepID=UPI001C9D3F5C|nr:uncharacterized protein LOC122415987 isoform X2 [Venturia canescens]